MLEAQTRRSDLCSGVSPKRGAFETASAPSRERCLSGGGGGVVVLRHSISITVISCLRRRAHEEATRPSAKRGRLHGLMLP